MRALWLVVLSAAILIPDESLAAKKKKRRRADPLSVVVLPFSGKGTGGIAAKEALELELELVEGAEVEVSDTLEDDVKRAGGKAFEGSTLASMLARRDVDVLVRGERGAGERSPDALLVFAYGKDGKPRFFRELSLGAEPDATAAAIIQALRPAIERWRSLKPVRVPEPDDDVGGDRLRPEDVLADVDEDKPRKKKSDDSERSVLDDEPESRIVDSRPAKKESPLAFNSSDDEELEEEDPRPKKKKRSRSLIDDDEPEEERIARADIDDDDESRRRRSSLSDLEDEVPPPSDKQALGHTVAITGAFDGATWFYNFDGNPIGQAQLNAPFFPGGSARIDAWPGTPFGIKFIGVDADFTMSVVPFEIDGGALAITPNQFLSYQTRAGGALKLRYSFASGLGAGLRAGYRYYGATVEPQTIQVGSEDAALTVVPGYSMHAGTIGAEVFLPLLIAGNRFELEVLADFLPLTYYEEFPDNPGAITVAFGWNALLAARYDIAGGFFIEGRGYSTGALIDYTQEGSRQIFVGNQLETLAGGKVTNLVAGFSLGAGFMF